MNETVGWPSVEKDSAKGDEKLRVLVLICRKESADEVWLHDAISLIPCLERDRSSPGLITYGKVGAGDL